MFQAAYSNQAAWCYVNRIKSIPGEKLWPSHQSQTYATPSNMEHSLCRRTGQQAAMLVRIKSNSHMSLTVLLKASIQFDLLKWICTNQVQTCRRSKFHVSGSKHVFQFPKKLKIESVRRVGRRSNGRKHENIACFLL